VLEQTFAVNFLGLLKVTNAFLPLLKRSKGAIVNDLSLAGLAPYRSYLPTQHQGRRAQLDAVTESALGRPRRDGPCSRLGPWTPI